MNETWISDRDRTNFDIYGFSCEHLYGNRTRNRGRLSGGITFYYRNELRKFIKVVQKEQCGIIRVKISADLFPFDQDVFICHIYIPPNSTNNDIYDQLETDIVKYNELGKVYVTGDMNCRTADALDYFIFDKYLDQQFSNINILDIPVRINKDRILDYKGRYLIELCQSTGLLIANGRLLGDENIGSFTFCSHQGQSTVDYLLLNYSDFETLSHFEILNFNEFSDHAPIAYSLYITSNSEHHDCDDNGISRKTRLGHL